MKIKRLVYLSFKIATQIYVTTFVVIVMNCHRANISRVIFKSVSQLDPFPSKNIGTGQGEGDLRTRLSLYNGVGVCYC